MKPPQVNEKIKNRITGSGEVNLDEILFNPKNWRVHPTAQQIALATMLSQVGWVQQVVVNSRTGNLVDGHLRCQIAARSGEKTIPVLFIDVSPEEESLILSTLDPIGQMAATDKEKLSALIGELDSFESQSVQDLLAAIALENSLNTLPDETGAGLDLLQITQPEPKHVVARGSFWRLGIHLLYCGSPVFEVKTWLPHLTDEMYFVPFASPTTLLAEKSRYKTVFAVNPDPYVCGHIVDRFAEINGEQSVQEVE